MPPIHTPSCRAAFARALSAGLAVSLSAAAAHAQWSVVNLHPTGANNSAANGGGGALQIGYAQLGPTVGHYRAALWSGTAASFVNLHPPTAVYSIGYAATDASQVGEVYVTGLPHAGLWSGTAASWVDLHPPGPSSSSALAVSGNQQVGRTFAGGYHAALWTGTAASWVDLNPPPTNEYNHSSEALAVSAGQQVGYVIIPTNMCASLWTGSAASWINLHPAGAYASKALGIGGGQQVGTVQPAAGNPQHAALWTGTAASWIDLHPAGAIASTAAATFGGTQVGWTNNDAPNRACLWTGSAASYVNLHAFLPAGFTSSSARAISSDGVNITIAGSGFNANNGRDEAILWRRPAPPPACPADIGVTGGTPGHDGVLDNNDFVVFIDYFFNQNPLADVGATGGVPGHDGAFDNNDFVVFIDRFFLGC